MSFEHPERKSAKKPFAYIASLRRTGSTLIAELLSCPPHSFVFREPRFARRNFVLKQPEYVDLLNHGIDLAKFRRDFLRVAPKERIAFLAKSISTGLLSALSQVGIKEIHHEGWERMCKFFPDMKIVLTGRDPRDIYISLYNMNETRRMQARPPLKLKGNEPFSPENVARDLRSEFEHQVAMFRRTRCLKVKYETLCHRPEKTLSEIRKFIGGGGWPEGKSGQYSPYNRRVHGDKVTTKRVNRWKSESNARLVDEARKVFGLMSRYCDFWDFEE